MIKVFFVGCSTNGCHAGSASLLPPGLISYTDGMMKYDEVRMGLYGVCELILMVSV
jgi:hypothetical protein